MRKIILFLIFVFFIFNFSVSAQMMRFNNQNTTSSTNDHTEKEEKEGQKVWEKLQKGILKCDKLKDEDYQVLGEYFMGLQLKENHQAANQMMVRMMGEKGEREAHINLGKKLSGCFNNYQFFTPMMGMMNGFSYWPMGWFFWIYWLIFSILILLVLFFLAVYLYKKITEKEKK